MPVHPGDMRPTPSIPVERGAALTALRRCHSQIFRSSFGRADLSRLGNGDGPRGALLIGGENSARRRTERWEAGSECPP